MATAGRNYEGVFHFRLSEECNFIDIKELSGIELEIKDKEGEIRSVVSFKVRLKEADTEEEGLEIAKSQAKRLVDVLAISAGKHLGISLQVVKPLISLLAKVRYLQHSSPRSIRILGNR